MDRFKFRAWYSESGEPEEMVYLKWNSNIGEHWASNTSDTVFEWGLLSALKEAYFTVMQCTGLKDKNGELIYEGDVVESVLDKKVERCVIKFDHNTGYMPEHGMAFDNSWIQHEVTGNIYENPELLEGKSNE